MKILVVDDEKLLVKGIKFNLENDGYEVVTAHGRTRGVYENPRIFGCSNYYVNRKI